MGTWSFVYDTLNRLTAGSVSSGPYAGLQTGWSYDGFGNRTAENFSGSTQAPMPTSSTTSYNANNQVSGTSLMLGAPLSYDGAGDVTQDNQNQYLYDGEGRICAEASTPIPGFTTMTGYVYDAEGNRVAKGTITTVAGGPDKFFILGSPSIDSAPSKPRLLRLGWETSTHGRLRENSG